MGYGGWDVQGVSGHEVETVHPDPIPGEDEPDPVAFKAFVVGNTQRKGLRADTEPLGPACGRRGADLSGEGT